MGQGNSEEFRMTTLPATEIELITKRTRYKAQCRALTQLGIDHRQAADGQPLVSTAVYEAWLGGGSVSEPKRPKLDMEAANAA